MSFPFKTLFVIVLLVVLLIPIQGLPEERAPNGQAIESKQEAPVEAPDLADIVPMAAQLNSRIADLRSQLEEGIDIAAMEKQYEEFGTRLQQLSARLDKLRPQMSQKK